MIRFAICDDEAFMAERISACLSEYMSEKAFLDYEAKCFPNGGALLESGEDFDMIFLDIQMEQPDGLETAKRLRKRGVKSLLVFVTVLSECVFDAFEVQAYDYLVKPIDGGRFCRMMDRAVGELSRKRAAASIIVRRGTACEVVWLADIAYCEVMGRKIYIHQKGGEVTDYYEKLEDLKRRVDGRFFRCHRSYLVNLDYVCGCSGGRIRLRGGEEIPVSRLREQELKQALLNHMAKKAEEK